MQMPPANNAGSPPVDPVRNVEHVRAEQHREDLAELSCFDRAQHRLGCRRVSEHAGAVVDRDDGMAPPQQRVGDAACAGTQFQHACSSRDRVVHDVRFVARRQQPIDLDCASILSDHTGTTTAGERAHCDTMTEPHTESGDQASAS